MFSRWIEPRLREKLSRPFVHILFGARQTGKTTLLRKLIPKAAIWLDFSVPDQRVEYLAEPDELIRQCRALPVSDEPLWVVVDEAQLVPDIFNAVQHLYDSDKTRWRFVLCGSSARKLRRTGANLLPGRSCLHRMHPLLTAERPFPETGSLTYTVPSPVPFEAAPVAAQSPLFPKTALVERMTVGELPGVAGAPAEQRPDILRSYCQAHLEEELRREALIKDWPPFAKFLRLAGAEAGQIVNYAKIAQQAGVSLPTIKNYYQLLEDMFLAFRLPAFSKSRRKNLLSTDRFFFADLGVRHGAAGLAITADTVLANPGPVFEQWVGIELWKRLQYLEEGHLHYLRAKSGMEIDFIVERSGQFTPIEVKWTDHPTETDARHLLEFLKEHPKQAKQAYIICRCSRPMEICEKVTALPWFCL
jgi:predicted AAA+ superfamily ATPase